ncbi:hypothetical protein ACFFWD_08990 [Bradyrhizobium erythrophlei]|uniref:hypothetical protein n=1 Tax=Bradyrhizobium erythrophlei TaxID=1437360 RepID=UPI0035E8E705
MTQANVGRGNGTAGDAARNFAKRVIAVQAEFSEKLVEAHRHWLEQVQIESTRALELLRNISGTASAAQQITSTQTWMKGVTERAAENTIFAIETAQALGKIELRLFARELEPDEASTAAA